MGNWRLQSYVDVILMPDRDSGMWTGEKSMTFIQNTKNYPRENRREGNHKKWAPSGQWRTKNTKCAWETLRFPSSDLAMWVQIGRRKIPWMKEVTKTGRTEKYLRPSNGWCDHTFLLTIGTKQPQNIQGRVSNLPTIDASKTHQQCRIKMKRAKTNLESIIFQAIE